jgi:hypothetical protein
VTFKDSVVGSVPDSGWVFFKVNGAVVDSAKINGSGVATVVKSNLAIGSSSIQAFYAGTVNYDTSSSNVITQVVNSVVVNVKVFLQGPYSGGTMRTDLYTNNYIPKKNPYGLSDSVAAIPASVVDWVLVQLRSNTTTTVATRAAFLTSNGTVVDTNGTSAIGLPGVPAGSYYIVVGHRNHLAVMSAMPVPLPGSYDFTTGTDKYYGGTDAAKDLGSGVWGMIGGNADNSDQDCFPSDLALIKTGILSGLSGYLNADVDMDGDVFPSDYALSKLNVLAGRSSQVP